MASSNGEPLSIGVLGAAKITPMALLKPARQAEGVDVVAVAARDPGRAEKFARRYRITRVCEDYEALINCDEINAIYNPLPNSHHAHWSIRAMKAGKHVLCEKPLASNAAEAQKMYEVAQAEGRILMEAFHWRYHPLAVRTIELLRAGTIGAIKRVEASFCIPLPLPGDIRYNSSLAGGGLMDTGCYTVSMLRHFAGEEPEVLSASARKASDAIDRFMEADFRFPSGASGHLRCSLWAWPLISVTVRVFGESGQLSIVNPIAPQILYHHLKVTTKAGRRTERFWGETTYGCQLSAFKTAIETGESPITDGVDGIKNMKVIDAIYRKAGMEPRVGLIL